jgi:hypothetical protein
MRDFLMRRVWIFGPIVLKFSTVLIAATLLQGCATVLVHARATPDKPRPPLYGGTLVDAVLALYLIDNDCDVGESGYGSDRCREWEAKTVASS